MLSADSAYSFFKLIELLMNDFHHPDHNLQRWVRRCNARDLTRFASLRIGDTVIVKPNERLAADGIDLCAGLGGGE